jgi:hypothetical protein
VELFALIMYVLAFVCFLGAAFGASRPRVNLIALGLAFAILPTMVATAKLVL